MSIILFSFIQVVFIAMDSEWEVETCLEIFAFVDQELCDLNCHFEAMEQDMKNTHIELTNVLSQCDKDKEENGWTT